MKGRVAEIRSERDRDRRRDDLLKLEPAAGAQRQRTCALSFSQPLEGSADGTNCTKKIVGKM